jgi:hypothetical protein
MVVARAGVLFARAIAFARYGSTRLLAVARVSYRATGSVSGGIAIRLELQEDGTWSHSLTPVGGRRLVHRTSARAHISPSRSIKAFFQA